MAKKQPKTLPEIQARMTEIEQEQDALEEEWGDLYEKQVAHKILAGEMTLLDAWEETKKRTGCAPELAAAPAAKPNAHDTTKPTIPTKPAKRGDIRTIVYETIKTGVKRAPEISAKSTLRIDQVRAAIGALKRDKRIQNPKDGKRGEWEAVPGN